MKTRSLLLHSLAVATFLTATAATTQAQTVITALPYTITTGGLYVLNSNLNSTVTTGNLITINASNVTIDFQNHYISGPVGNTTQNTVGLFATQRSNLTIKNGTIAYCVFGIYITGNNTATTNNVDHQITNMRITYCYYGGIVMDFAPSSVISNCQISQIGTTSTNLAIGINVTGAGVTVQGCSVSNIFGINSNCIYSDPGSFTRQCQVSNATFGVQTGIYQDNLAHSCTNAFSGGTDAGGNVHD